MREESQNGTVCWLRNLSRKKWLLAISYEVNGVSTSVFPNRVIVRAGSQGSVFDILEPHDPSRKDNCPKTCGLAKFAADGRDHFYGLDMSTIAVINKVRGMTSSVEPDRMLNTNAVCRDRLLPTIH